MNDDQRWDILEAIAKKIVTEQWGSKFEYECLEDANDYSERE